MATVTAYIDGRHVKPVVPFAEDLETAQLTRACLQMARDLVNEGVVSVVKRIELTAAQSERRPRLLGELGAAFSYCGIAAGP